MTTAYMGVTIPGATVHAYEFIHQFASPSYIFLATSVSLYSSFILLQGQSDSCLNQLSHSHRFYMQFCSSRWWAPNRIENPVKVRSI